MSKVHFYRETKFKKTEIGEIPEGWEVRKLGEYIKDFVRGVSYKQSDIKFEPGKNFIPLLRATNLKENQLELRDLIFIPTNKVRPKQYLKKDDFIITTSSGTKTLVGRVLYLKEELNKPITIGAFLAIVRIKGIDKNFVYYIFNSQLYRRYLANIIAGTNINNLNRKVLFEFSIPLPPLEEQKAIAKVLKDFDDLIEVIDKKIETYNRIKKKLMEIYFTRGVFEHKTFKDTEIGRIPEGWKTTILYNLLNSRKPLIKGRKPNPQGKNLIPYINTEYLRNNQPSEYSSIQSKEFLIKEDDILILWDGSNAGEIFKGKYGVLGSTFVKLNFTSDKDFYKSFLFYFLKYKAEPFLKLNTQGTGIPHVDRNILLNFKIPLPPLEEQKEIAKRLKAIDDQIENLRKQKEHLQRVKKKFMDLLLTGKLRIKIN